MRCGSCRKSIADLKHSSVRKWCSDDCRAAGRRERARARFAEWRRAKLPRRRLDLELTLLELAPIGAWYYRLSCPGLGNGSKRYFPTGKGWRLRLFEPPAGAVGGPLRCGLLRRARRDRGGSVERAGRASQARADRQRRSSAGAAARHAEASGIVATTDRCDDESTAQTPRRTNRRPDTARPAERPALKVCILQQCNQRPSVGKRRRKSHGEPRLT
jgi:hypothetical protein